MNGYAYFWGISATVLEFLNWNADSEMLRSMVFTSVLSTFSTIIDMPFVVYYTFWLEERHGFNKQVEHHGNCSGNQCCFSIDADL